MEQWKKRWTEHWLKLAVTGFFTLMVLLFNQQNSVIAKNSDMLEKTCSKYDSQLKDKVDNETLKMMIESQNRDRQDNKDKWVKQDHQNEKMLDSINDLNKNVLLLNEKMK